MPLPITRSAADALGRRLRHADDISDDDADLLLAIMQAYQRALDDVQERLRARGYDPTSRTKTTQVLIEKLRREQSSLKSVHDIAGARIVKECDRLEQDDIVADICSAFDDGGKPPKVIDRREVPTHGYRAVHVIVTVQELPVEIQVRTAGQDLWAQITESLGDAWGRGIRYGQPPPAPDEIMFTLDQRSISRADFWGMVLYLSEQLDGLERLQVDLERRLIDEQAMLDRGVRTHEEEDARFAQMEEIADLKAENKLAEEKLRRDLALIARIAKGVTVDGGEA